MGDKCSLFVDDKEVPEKEEGPKKCLEDHCLKASLILLHSTKGSVFSAFARSLVNGTIVVVIYFHEEHEVEVFIEKFKVPEQRQE
jgi:hypothetical protein